MTEQCTMYCRIKDCDSLEERLSILEPTSIVFDERKPWSKCTCRTSGGVLQISRKVFAEPGDDFSRIVYGTYVKFRSHEEDNPTGTKQVLSHLDETELLLGIVADPDFESIAMLDELLTWIGVEFDGLIFNGAEMLDFQGNVIV